jgi:hypothetical protein
MDISLEERVFEGVDKNKILGVFPRAVLGGALMKTGKAAPELPPPPPVSFRAAAMANMSYRPLGGGEYSFEWTTGRPAWLPRPKG